MRASIAVGIVFFAAFLWHAAIQTKAANSTKKKSVTIVRALELAMITMDKSDDHKNAIYRVKIFKDGDEWNIYITYLPVTPDAEVLVVVGEDENVEVYPSF